MSKKSGIDLSSEDLVSRPFFVHGRAVPQPRYTQTWSTKGRRLAFIGKNHPIHWWKNTVRIAAREVEQASWPLTGPVALSLSFRNPGRGDLDNLVKAVKDALQGIVYVNDSQVEYMMAEKRRAEGEPMLTIVVEWEEEK
jgi:Holliday junction resolvase RusA-like endonuclease